MNNIPSVAPVPAAARQFTFKLEFTKMHKRRYFFTWSSFGRRGSLIEKLSRRL